MRGQVFRIDVNSVFQEKLKIEKDRDYRGIVDSYLLISIFDLHRKFLTESTQHWCGQV